jgi:hypothetical protein
MDLRPMHALIGIVTADLGLVLARRETTCSAGNRAVRCDKDAGPDRCHDCGPAIARKAGGIRSTCSSGTRI